MRVRIKVEGGDKLARRLQMLAEETARKHMKEAALEGAEVIRAEAVEKAPRGKTGTLKDNIYKEVTNQTKNRIEIHIGPGGKGWYGRLVEEGHAIVVGGSRKVKGKPGRVVGHAPPYPFLRPAFDEKTDEAQEAFVKVLRRGLKL